MTNACNFVKLPLQTLSARPDSLSSVLIYLHQDIYCLPLNYYTLNSYPVTWLAHISMEVFHIFSSKTRKLNEFQIVPL